MQFKKVTSIFLMVLILFSNLGLAVNVHYCHDRIASISLDYQEKEACVKEKKEKNKDEKPKEDKKEYSLQLLSLRHCAFASNIITQRSGVAIVAIIT